MNERDRAYMQSWLVTALAHDLDENRECDLIDLCEHLDIEPEFKNHIDGNRYLKETTVIKAIAKKLINYDA